MSQPQKNLWLPIEIWYIVIKQCKYWSFPPDAVYASVGSLPEDQDRMWLASLRFVCKDFNIALKPALYYHQSFDEHSLRRMVEQSHSLGFPRDHQKNIAKYTSVFRFALDGMSVKELTMIKRMLSAAPRLDCVMWFLEPSDFSYTEPIFRLKRMVTMCLRACLKTQMPWGLRICILPSVITMQVLRKQGYVSRRSQGVIRKVRIEHTGMETPSSVVSPLSLDSTTLKVLQIEDSFPYGYGFRHLTKKWKIPPMKDLRLIETPWIYESDEIARVWDFSQVERLELEYEEGPRELIEFFKKTPGELFKKLEDISIYGGCGGGDLDGSPTTLTYFHTFVQNTPALRRLKVEHTCWRKFISLEALKSMGECLISLKINGRCILRAGLSAKELHKINRWCPNLAVLSFRITCEDPENDLALQMLSEFKCLKDLTINKTRDLLIKRIRGECVSDPTYASAGVVMRNLHNSKIGIPFEKIKLRITLSLPPPALQLDFDCWSPVRTFYSCIDENGNFKQWAKYFGGTGSAKAECNIVDSDVVGNGSSVEGQPVATAPDAVEALAGLSSLVIDEAESTE